MKKLLTKAKRSAKIIYDNKIYRATCCIVLALVLVATTIAAYLINNKSSVAYLYDEHNVSVNYSVAQLSFELSSNHMYSYYSNQTKYNDEFEGVLTNLESAINNFDNGSTSISDLNISVKSIFTNFYCSEFVSALQNAWDNNTSSQNEYDDATRLIYNKYYNSYQYLFKLKSFQISSVETGMSIWYYYAKDLVNTYSKEYIVQDTATGVKQSTVKIGVKLKGGTTYSSYQDGYYYDENFNDMVNGLTLNLKNNGNVNLYLNYLIDMESSSNTGKGILGMVLPYGMTLDSLKSDTNFYDSTNKKFKYHQIVKYLLSNRDTYYTSSINSVDCDSTSDTYGTLKYSSLESLITEWNNYAVGTYVNNDDTNAVGNVMVTPDDSTRSDALKNVKASMIFWADYQKNAEYYNNEKSADWATDNAYQLISYNFKIDIQTSIKNRDMTDYNTADWEQLFNSREVYEKYAAVSNFDVEGYAYFEESDGDGGYTVTNAKQHMKGGYIICNYTDPTAVNYISKLRFDVRYRGFSPSYIRVRMIEQFTNSLDEIEAVNQIKFDLENNWFDNRAEDFYFYSKDLFYSTENSTLTTSGKPKFLTIPIINGLSKSYSSVDDIDPTLSKNGQMTLKLTFFVEAVQPNRTESYWGKTVPQIESICK